MSPRQYTDLFETAPCGFLSFTDDGRIVVVNETLLGLLGYTREALMGHPVESVMTLATRLFYQTHFFPLVTLHGRADEIYLAFRSASGTEVAVFVNAVRREEAGTAVTHCVLFPVHQRRKYEDELLNAKKEAEAALASKEVLTHDLTQALADLRAAQDRLVEKEKLASLGRMAAGVAHEIKNPLNFVVNFAELIAERVADLRALLSPRCPDGSAASPAAVNDLLDDLTLNASRIVAHGQRADAIVRGMLEHQRDGSDAARLPVDLNRLVEARIAAARERGRPGALPVRTVLRDLGADVGVVEGSAEDLGRMLDHLLDNALDAVAARAAAEDPSYRPQVTVQTRRTDGSVGVEVADNGVGLPDPDRARVFEPFFTTKAPGSGHIGLGLSLAYEIVQRHGGTLTADRAPGEGARFTVTLPASPLAPEGSDDG